MLEIKKLLKKGGYKIKPYNIRDDDRNNVEDFFYFDKNNYFINEIDKRIILFQSNFSEKNNIFEKLDSRTIKLTFYKNKTAVSYYYDLVVGYLFKVKLKGLTSKREKIYYKFIGAEKWRKAKIKDEKYETCVYFD